MADTKILQLNIASVLDGTEQVPIVQAGTTVRVSAQNIADLSALNYTPENTANKSVDFTTVNNTKYPSVQAVVGYSEKLANKAVDFSVKDNTKYPTTLAVDTYIGTKVGYTEYVALLTQSDTNAPIATTVFNNTGKAFSFNKADVGSFFVVPDTPFVDQNKVVPQLIQDAMLRNYGAKVVNHMEYVVEFYTGYNNVATDGLLNNTRFVIRIYN